MHTARDSENCTMLIVEDHPLTRRTLHQFVQVHFPHIAIVEAADGAQAMAACSQYEPQVVLMDIGLPDTDGITLTEKVLQMLPQARVIMVTLHSGSPYVELARAAGAFAYVVKERVVTELVSAVTRALDGWQESEPAVELSPGARQATLKKAGKP